MRVRFGFNFIGKEINKQYHERIEDNGLQTDQKFTKAGYRMIFTKSYGTHGHATIVYTIEPMGEGHVEVVTLCIEQRKGENYFQIIKKEKQE